MFLAAAEIGQHPLLAPSRRLGTRLLRRECGEERTRSDNGLATQFRVKAAARWSKGQSTVTLPQTISGALDVHLLRNRQRVVNFNPEISRGALNLAVPQ